jgi:hypothetical protein
MPVGSFLATALAECEIRLKPDGYSEAMPDAVPGEAGHRSDAKPDTIPK